MLTTLFYYSDKKNQYGSKFVFYSYLRYLSDLIFLEYLKHLYKCYKLTKTISFLSYRKAKLWETCHTNTGI